MPNRMGLNIDLKKAANSQSLTFLLQNDFFKGLEQNEIFGGEVEATVCVKEPLDGRFKLSVSVKGTVVVQCDRCLDEMELPVEGEDNINISADDDEAIGDDTIILPPNVGYNYDLGWYIYELVALLLPIQRVHADGECNEDMESLLRSMKSSELSENEKDTFD